MSVDFVVGLGFPVLVGGIIGSELVQEPGIASKLETHDRPAATILINDVGMFDDVL